METQRNVTVKLTVEFHSGNDVLDFYQATQVVRVLSMRTGMSFQPPQQELVSQLFGIWKSEVFDHVLISFPPRNTVEEEE